MQKCRGGATENQSNAEGMSVEPPGKWKEFQVESIGRFSFFSTFRGELFRGSVSCFHAKPRWRQTPRSMNCTHESILNATIHVMP